jgi:hypothetical protein
MPSDSDNVGSFDFCGTLQSGEKNVKKTDVTVQGTEIYFLPVVLHFITPLLLIPFVVYFDPSLYNDSLLLIE